MVVGWLVRSSLHEWSIHLSNCMIGPDMLTFETKPVHEFDLDSNRYTDVPCTMSTMSKSVTYVPEICIPIGRVSYWKLLGLSKEKCTQWSFWEHDFLGPKCCKLSMLQKGTMFGSDVHRQFSEVLLRGAKKSFLPASGFPANDSWSHSSDPFTGVLLHVQVIQQSLLLKWCTILWLHQRGHYPHVYESNIVAFSRTSRPLGFKSIDMIRYVCRYLWFWLVEVYTIARSSGGESKGLWWHLTHLIFPARMAWEFILRTCNVCEIQGQVKNFVSLYRRENT